MSADFVAASMMKCGEHGEDIGDVRGRRRTFVNVVATADSRFGRGDHHWARDAALPGS